jgi:zinc protease
LNITETILNNGITLLTIEDHAAPVLTLMLWVPAGARTEAEGLTGISHYLEHNYSMGSSKLQPREIDAIVARCGGQKNAFTGWDYTAYFENLPKEHLALFCELEADRLATLALPEEFCISERDVITEERRRSIENSQFGLVYETMNKTAFTTHTYSHPIIGWMEDIRAYDREKAWNYYRQHYATQNVTFVLSGDFDTAEAVNTFRQHFEPIPAGAKPTLDVPAEPPQTEERRAVVEKQVQLPAVYVGWHVPDVDHPDAQPLSLLADVLAGGRSSRFTRILKNERKLVTFASAHADQRADPGLFTVMAQAQRGVDIEAIEGAIDEQTDFAQQTLVTDAELRKAKNRVEAAFVLGLETAQSKASVVGYYHTVSQRGWRFLDDYLSNLLNVTAEDIQRVARQYLIRTNRTVVTLKPVNGLR